MLYKNLSLIIASIFLSLTLSCTTKPKPVINEIETTAPDSVANAVDTSFSTIEDEKTITDSLIFPDNEKQIVQILQTGKLNAEDVNKNAVNKKWIGLFKIGSMYFLRLTSIEITPTTDTNSNIVRKSLLVSTSVFNRCVILMSGLPELSAKDLQTVLRHKDTILPGDQINMNLKNNIYTLKAEGRFKKNNDGTFEVRNYKLFLLSTLNNFEVKQLLVAKPLLKNQMITVVWTGDLDGDNKLDLILDASPDEGISTPALYLSSKAGQKELVKFAGQHIAK